MRRLYEIATRALHFFTFPLAGLFLHNSRRVRVLVCYKDSILLQRSSYGNQRWSVPGGGVEKHETAMQAAIREVKEEVGITISEADLICIGEQRVPSRKRWPAIDMVFYKIELINKVEPRITRPLEILAVNWFKLTDIPEKHSKTVDIALGLKPE